MGDVELSQGACVAAMRGRPIPNPGKLLRLIRGGGTPNQERMAIAAGLYDETLVAEAVPAALRVLERDEREGPASPELVPPAPHGNMYSMELIGRTGCRHAEIAARSAVVLGWWLRLGDLVVERNGSVDGLPGGRAPRLAGLDRRHFAQEWAEVRRRQGDPRAVLRGTGGKARKNPDKDTPAWWLRQILDGPRGPELLAGPLSRSAPLPPAMRLPLTVWRWEEDGGGTLAAFADPATEELFLRQLKPGQQPKPFEFDLWRANVIDGFRAHGSKAAIRNREPEPVADWIMVEWSSGRRPRRVTTGKNWTIMRPEPPPGATVTRIPGPTGRVQPPAPPVMAEPSLAHALELAREISAEANLL